MNSNNTKTLLITTALAVRLLSIAQGLTATKVEDNSERVIDKDLEFEGYTIEHIHADYGPQRLLVDQIHENLYSVSFAGRQEYMDMIGTQGWASSAEALVNYLVDMNPELELSLDDFRCDEIGNDYVVYSLADEGELDLDDPQLAKLFLGNLFQQASQEFDNLVSAVGEQAFEDVVRPVEDAVQSDVIDATMDAGSQAADHPEDVDAPRVASFRQKAMNFIASPMGVAACAVAGAVIFFGCRMIADSINLPAPAEELLG